MSNILTLDSITKLPAQVGDAVAYCASHAGRFSGMLALKAGIRAVILCDAGVGLQQAGIASLEMLQEYGVPAATVGHNTARIGNGQDGYEQGLISYVNAAAVTLGVRVGDPCSQALEKLASQVPAVPKHDLSTLSITENRGTIELPGAGRVILADSNSLVKPSDTDEVVVCGSHGGILGNDPLSAVRVDVRAILFNDADRGLDNAGLSRLPALDDRLIPAGCVSAWTACIGDAQSSYRTGIVSALNETAKERGAVLGMSAKEFALQLFESARLL